MIDNSYSIPVHIPLIASLRRFDASVFSGVANGGL